MPSIDVILEQPDIVVLGGPSNIELQLDTGATGQRGSLIYVGSGLPSSSTIPNYSSILPGDMYINVAQGQTYLWMYQYIVKPGGNTWEPISSLGISPYSAIYELNYGDDVAGEGTISIPISNIIVTSSTLTASNFSVTFSFEHSNPIAASIKNKVVASGNLSITFTAMEYDGSDWVSYVDTTAKIAAVIKVIA